METLNWEEFTSQSVEEQVNQVNEIIKSNQKMTVNDISEKVFNQSKSMLSKHMTSMGYSFKGRQYVIDANKSNQMITDNYTSNNISSNVNKSNQMITLNMYSAINEILVELDTKETERATVKIAKDTSDKLDEFLKQHKILKKQDVISVAIELFLNKFN